MLNFFAHRWVDIVLALTFALLADLVRVGSVARGIARQIKNRMAEYSVARLQKRIAALERQKRNWLEYLASDKPIYLETMRLILIILYFICGGFVLLAGSFLIASLRSQTNGRIVWIGGAILLFLFGLIAAAQGMVGTRRKGKPKNVERFVSRLDREIVDLKSKLASRLGKR